MKKLLSLILAVSLLGTLGLTAAAADVASDQELKNVTALVKNTLDLDTEAYTDFNGWSSEDLLIGKRWYLSWSGDGIYMSVTADQNGKIYSFSRSDAGVEEPITPYDYYGGGSFRIPALPEDKSTQALQAAQDFLDRVLDGELESAQLADNSQPSLYRTAYRYYGTVKLNGVDSPISCSLTVRPQDLAVTRFSRSDQSSGYLGSVPTAETEVSEAQARLLLKPTLDMEAKYVLSDDGKTATVQYVPISGDDYYVDAASGKLVNLTELRKKLSIGVSNKYFAYDSVMEAPAEAETSLASGLTQAELEGSAKLADALDKEELTRVLTNTWPELGLKDYTLSSAYYTVYERRESEDAQPEYDVTCRLTYGKTDGKVTPVKTVTVDAKTGALQSVYTRRYYENKKDIEYLITFPEAQRRANSFMEIFAADHMDLVEITDSFNAKAEDAWEYSFTYTHTANGYYYYSNNYVICLDAVDGTISRVSKCFDDTVELVKPMPPHSIIAKDTAIDIYAAALEVPYRYLEIPVPVTDAKDVVYMNQLQNNGYEYVLALKPGYVFSQPSPSIRSVDIVTGKVVYSPESDYQDKPMTYDDIEDSWVKEAAEALAVFKVGFGGGSLQPTKVLTQLDMVALLCSVNGYSFDPNTAGKQEVDWLYNCAYSMGIVTPETREEDKEIHRGDLVRLILDGAGYQKIASLSHIFRCDFTDADDISEEDLGYAALAQGLGLVRGDDHGAYAAGRIATRSEAVAMLYQYMKR